MTPPSQSSSKQYNKTDKNNPPAPPPPPTHLIQPWHVVLGDTSCRNHRTTAATAVLRQIKRQARTKYFGQKKEKWVPLAIQELQQRLQGMQEFKAADDRTDVGCVLIKCTPKAVNSGRVAQPFLYGYAGDNEAWYGLAQMPTALEFFLTSRDGPQLADELNKHADNVQKAILCAQQQQQHGNHASPHYLQQFEETVQFFQAQSRLAEQGNVLAAKLLESLKPINALKEQWKLVQQQQRQQRQQAQEAAATALVETIPTDATTTTSHASSSSSSVESRRNNNRNITLSATKHVNIPAEIFNSGNNMIAVPLLGSVPTDTQQQSKHFYPEIICDNLPPCLEATTDEEDSSPSSAPDMDPLPWQDDDDNDVMDLDKLDVDGFMADLELADDDVNTKDIMLLDNNNNNVNCNVVPTAGRRNRADSDDCSSVLSGTAKPRVKRSRKANVTTAVAALATLATFVAVNTPSSSSSSRPFSADAPTSKDVLDVQPSSRLLQKRQQQDFGWEKPHHEQKQHHEDSKDWCKREINNPFASLGGVGDFLCSLDLGAHFGLSDMEDEDDDGHFDDNFMDVYEV